jgi:cephalosporin hydroxylase
MIDITASIRSLANNEHVHESGPWKIAEDLTRYEKIIEESRPEVIVETGTRNGESARWFELVGDCDVITIDTQPVTMRAAPARIKTIMGSSVHPRVLRRVYDLVAGRRAMVSLDSAHDAAHVSSEIVSYAPLVAVNCYLVIEDGIFHYADQALRQQHALADMVGDPLGAVLGSFLPHSRRWVRNRLVEDMFPVTHHPAGWWRRVAR